MVGYTGQTPDTRESRGAWMEQAACRQAHPDLFFNPALETDARRTCYGCPVLMHCRRWILRTESGKGEDWRDGIVAGLSPKERARLDVVLLRRLAELAKGKAAKKAARNTEAAPEASTDDATTEPTAVTEPRPAPAAAPEPEPEPAPLEAPAPRRQVPKCGTDAAHRRHIKRGEPIDPQCRAAHTLAERERRYAGDERAVYAQWVKAKTDEQIAAATGLPVLRVRRTRKRLGLIENQPLTSATS